MVCREMFPELTTRTHRISRRCFKILLEAKDIVGKGEHDIAAKGCQRLHSEKSAVESNFMCLFDSHC